MATLSGSGSMSNSAAPLGSVTLVSSRSPKLSSAAPAGEPEVTVAAPAETTPGLAIASGSATRSGGRRPVSSA